MLSVGGTAPPQRRLRIDERRASGYTFRDGASFEGILLIVCQRSSVTALFQLPPPRNHASGVESIFWLVAVDPTNLGPQINIFISCTNKTKYYAGSQNTK